MKTLTEEVPKYCSTTIACNDTSMLVATSVNNSMRSLFSGEDIIMH